MLHNDNASFTKYACSSKSNLLGMVIPLCYFRRGVTSVVMQLAIIKLEN